MSSRFRTRNLTLVLAIWHSLLTFGRRRRPIRPKRILVAHHLLLGDTLMLTPLLAKLREQHPQAEIVMTVPKLIAPLFQKRPFGVLAIPYDPRDIRTLHELLKNTGFDLAIVPGDNRHSWLARALGSKWVVAHAGDRPAYKNWLVDELMSYPNKPAAWGDMVAALVDGPPPAPYDKRSWQAPDYLPFDLPATPYCVLHVGASSPLKMWSKEKWQALAQHLAQKGFQVVWSGGPGEQKYVVDIDPQGHHRSFAGQLDLPQLWQLTKQASLLVCPDTGVAHLGRLVGTPTVTLFGPGSAVICGAGDFWRNAPYHAATAADFPCRDQNLLFRRQIDWVNRCGRDINQCAEPKCMQAIHLETVIAAVDALT